MGKFSRDKGKRGELDVKNKLGGSAKRVGHSFVSSPADVETDLAVYQVRNKTIGGSEIAQELPILGKVFDSRLGAGGGSKYRDPKTGRLVPRPKGTMFRCRFCGEDKPLDDMRRLTRFFPPLVACRECEGKVD